jgi:hypothetical protein
MVFQIADLRVKVILPENYIPKLPYFNSVTADYCVPDTALFDFKIIIGEKRTSTPKTLPASPQSFTIVTINAAQSWINCRTSKGKITWPKRTLQVFFYENMSEPDMLVIDYLKLIFSFLVLEKGGLPLHCSSVFKGEAALAFFGPSEAGKSTIARLFSPPWRILSDELNFILPQNNTYMVYSTPFCPKNYELCSKSSAPLKFLFSLEKGKRNEVIDLPLSEKFKSLVFSLYTIAINDRYCQLSFSNVIEICRHIPVQKLSFLKNKSVVATIQGLIGDNS